MKLMNWRSRNSPIFSLFGLFFLISGGLTVIQDEPESVVSYHSRKLMAIVDEAAIKDVKIGNNEQPENGKFDLKVLYSRFENDEDIKKLRSDPEIRLYVDYWIDLFNSTADEVDSLADLFAIRDQLKDSLNVDQETFKKMYNENLAVESKANAINQMLLLGKLGDDEDGNASTPPIDDMYKFLELGQKLIDILTNMEQLVEMEQQEEVINEVQIQEEKNVPIEEEEDLIPMVEYDENDEEINKVEEKVEKPAIKEELKSTKSSMMAPAFGYSFLLIFIGVIGALAYYKRAQIRRLRFRIRNHAFRRLH